MTHSKTVKWVLFVIVLYTYFFTQFIHQKEICTNDGILLRRGPAAFLPDIMNNTTGTLSLMHYVQNNNNILCIEWKPNDFLIADADANEQGEWSFVDTIAKRQRTASECLVFNAHNESISHRNSSPTAAAAAVNTAASSPPPPATATATVPTTTKMRVIRVVISELRHIEVLKNGHLVRLVNKSDTAGKVHSEYFFQHGNAEGFVRGLQTTHCLQRSHNKRDQYEIVDNVEHDQEKLKKTFAELRIDDIKGGAAGSGWISSMVRDPFTHTMGFLAKMSDAYQVLPGVGGGAPIEPHRHSGKQTPSPTKQVAPPAGGGDEYEVLVTSRGAVIGMNDDVGGGGGNEQSAGEKSIKELEDRLPARPTVVRGSPLTPKQWCEFQSEDGRISDVDRVKEIIFRGGCEHELRAEVWKYLLGYMKWDETKEQRIRHQRQRNAEYFKMKMQWLSMTDKQESNHLGFQSRKCQIEKDVKRTDRTIDYFAGDNNPNVNRLQDILMTYVMYNFDLGYVQGMSDLLAPILCVMQDEVDSFWCFVGFMEMVDVNFDIDQAGMKRQLKDCNQLLAVANPRLYQYFADHESDNMYMCFRWLLVWFKREFTHYDIMAVWETMWTGLPCANFHLLISVAILDEQMHIFIDQEFEFNEILKHINDMSYKIDYREVLQRAEAIYLQIRGAHHLTDEVRIIIGEEPMAPSRGGSGDGYGDDEDDYDFDNIVPPGRSTEEMMEVQKKWEEACERSMWNTLF